jgi:hypothetical protein
VGSAVLPEYLILIIVPDILMSPIEFD